MINRQIFVLTISPPYELSSATFLVCFNFQCASMLLNIGENVVLVSNSFDPDEAPNIFGVSSGSKLFVFSKFVVLGRIMAK